MPEISRFFGIVMDYNDHEPPHFHVRYSGQKAIVEIESLAVIAGRLSPRVSALVNERASLHKDELQHDWERARQQAPLSPIAPLE
jgi:hypothetical protein